MQIRSREVLVFALRGLFLGGLELELNLARTQFLLERWASGDGCNLVDYVPRRLCCERHLACAFFVCVETAFYVQPARLPAFDSVASRRSSTRTNLSWVMHSRAMHQGVGPPIVWTTTVIVI